MILEDYLYNINKNTRTSEDLEKFKSKEQTTCIKKYLKIFCANYLSNSSLFFICSLFLCSKMDNDCFIVKLLFLLLFITLYMVFNILTEVNTSTLHVNADHEYEEDSPSHLDRTINYFFPFIALYWFIAWMRKALFKSIYFIRTYQKLEEYEKYLSEHNNSENENKKYKCKYIKTIAIKEIETDIEKTRNQFEIQTKIIFIYGGILLFINWILVTSFCGIYINSFGDVILNIFISILFSILFSLILNIFSTIVKYCNFDSKCCKLSEILNLKKIASFTYNKCCCSFSYFICCYDCCCYFSCCNWCKDEFIEEEEESKNNIVV